MNWLRGTRVINVILVSESRIVLPLLPRPHLRRLNMENSPFPNALAKTISLRQCNSLWPFLFSLSTRVINFLLILLVMHSSLYATSLFGFHCSYQITPFLSHFLFSLFKKNSVRIGAINGPFSLPPTIGPQGHDYLIQPRRSARKISNAGSGSEMRKYARSVQIRQRAYLHTMAPTYRTPQPRTRNYTPTATSSHGSANP